MAGQAWLLRRLEGLQPFHFEEGTSTRGIYLIGCSPELSAPAAFAPFWSTFDLENGAFGLTAQQLSAATAVLIFSNPFVPDQVRATSMLVQTIDAFGAHAPPMFWVLHTVAPEMRDPYWTIQALNNELFGVLEAGLDGLIADEPSGMRLALRVRTMILKSEHMSQTLNDIINTRRARAVQGSNLEEQIHSIIWHYLCARMAPNLPPCNHSLSTGRLTEIAGFAVGRVLEEGAFGKVYALTPPGDPDDIREVLQVITKTNNSTVHAIKRLRTVADVLRHISSDQWQHPNLLKLLETYHSKMHLMFRIGYGGSVTLFQRLKTRNQTDEDQRQLLPLPQVQSVIKQMLAVLAHLHNGPGICHRDLKPENFTLVETPEEPEPLLKLQGFDLAVTLGLQVMCRSVCGTIPFVAPEVLTEPEYNGRAADAWSCGVVMLEILCFATVMETFSELCSRSALPNSHFGHLMAENMACSENLEALLRKHCREDLRPLQQPLWPATRGVLSVYVPLRWRVDQARAHVVNAFKPM